MRRTGRLGRRLITDEALAVEEFGDCVKAAAEGGGFGHCARNLLTTTVRTPAFVSRCSVGLRSAKGVEMRGVRSVALVACAGLIATGCASEGSLDEEAGGPSDSAAEDSELVLEGSGAEDPAPLLTLEEIEEVDEFAAAAVVLFGSEDDAIDALLFALDAGYNGTQIIEALRAESLTAGGVIPGVDPEQSGVGLVVGFRRAAPEPLPVEQLRRALRGTAEDGVWFRILEEGRNATGDERGGVPGANGVRVLLLLVWAGYSSQAIIESLVLGPELVLTRCRATGITTYALRVGNTIYPPQVCGGPEKVGQVNPPSTGSEEDASGATEAPSDDAVTGSAEEDEPTAAETVEVDSALYDVYPVEGQLEDVGYSIIDGVLEVIAAEGELTVTGTVVVEKTLFGPEVGTPICTSVQAVDVTATAPIEPEMRIRLQATAAEPFEVKAYTDQCKPDKWKDNAQVHQQWMFDNGPATVYATVEGGTLIGSVNNGISANNLERAS